MIQFKNVSFSYAPEHPVVENLSFSIQAGESVGLIGANGAGKSTIMNAMLDAWCPETVREDRKVFEADMLFATLDTTIRRIEVERGREFLLSDTVGFIHKLPTALVEAFKSTLEEVKEADLLALRGMAML